MVLGTGPHDAAGLVLGEAPGAEEERQGLPFVGRSGELLNEALESVGLTRDELYVTNVIKERPPENQTPTDSEIQAARSDLWDEIKMVNPTAILALGLVAARALHAPTALGLPPKLTMGRLLTSPIQYYFDTSRVVFAYHPAYILRNRTVEPAWLRDIGRFAELVTETY